MFVTMVGARDYNETKPTGLRLSCLYNMFFYPEVRLWLYMVITMFHNFSKNGTDISTGSVLAHVATNVIPVSRQKTKGPPLLLFTQSKTRTWTKLQGSLVDVCL